MPLPELLTPRGSPCFLLADHGITPDPLHDDLTFKQGHGRKRKVQTYAPRVVQVSVDLSAEQAATWDAWFENSLVVGHARFTASVGRLGEDSRYWAAQWVGPPLWVPRAAAGGRTRWRLSGQLLLTGEGSDTPPLGATLATEYAVPLLSTVAITSGLHLATEYEIALIGTMPLTTEYTIALLRVIPSFELRADGGFELRADGGLEKRNG